MKSAKILAVISLLHELNCDFEWMKEKYDNIVDIDQFILSFKEHNFCHIDYSRRAIKSWDGDLICLSCPFKACRNSFTYVNNSTGKPSNRISDDVETDSGCILIYMRHYKILDKISIMDVYEALGAMKNEQH